MSLPRAAAAGHAVDDHIQRHQHRNAAHKDQIHLAVGHLIVEEIQVAVHAVADGLHRLLGEARLSISAKVPRRVWLRRRLVP